MRRPAGLTQDVLAQDGPNKNEPNQDGLTPDGLTPDQATTIRFATSADLPALLAMVATCADAPRWTPKLWQDLLCAERNDVVVRLVLLAHTADELCGVLAATLLVGQAELESVLVRAGCRRRGVGRALVNAWLAWAAENGAGSAHLEVRESHAAALQLYREIGLSVIGRRRAYYHDPPEDALLMSRELP